MWTALSVKSRDYLCVRARDQKQVRTTYAVVGLDNKGISRQMSQAALYRENIETRPCGKVRKGAYSSGIEKQESRDCASGEQR